MWILFEEKSSLYEQYLRGKEGVCRIIFGEKEEVFMDIILERKEEFVWIIFGEKEEVYMDIIWRERRGLY